MLTESNGSSHRWEAVLAIQRVYRRWKLWLLIGASAYNQLRRTLRFRGGHRQSMISSDFHTHGIVVRRKDACTVITTFLRGLASLTRVLIRKYLM